MIDLATLGGSASQALSINAGGQMVGLSTTTGQQRKFASLYTDSKVVNLGVLGDAESKGLRMNRRRQIGALWFSGKVAFPNDSSGRAMLWQNGTFIELSKLIPPLQSGNGWEYLYSPEDLTDDDGTIVGNGQYNNGTYPHFELGYALTPAHFIFIGSPSLSGGTFSFTIYDRDNITCTVQATTNLTSGSWITLGAVTVQSGSGVFNDTNAGQYTQRFYRVSSGSLTSGDVVGFLVKTLPSGWSEVSDPFDTTDNRVPALFAAAPSGTTVYKFNEATQMFIPNQHSSGWNSYLMTLYPGEAAQVNTPSSFTVQWVGTVRQNCLQKRIVASGIHSSLTALGGTVDGVLHFPVANGDTISILTDTLGNYTNYTYNNGSWSPSQPSVAVGQGFWSSKNAPVIWQENYSAW
ncbi:MAG: hypothetical protein DME19_11425 [Verrucomicrobia bacterium]|nr:MAG: hypothetical protein DME19_11425 [Verrucomicrobiota bacterium]